MDKPAIPGAHSSSVVLSVHMEGWVLSDFRKGGSTRWSYERSQQMGKGLWWGNQTRWPSVTHRDIYGRFPRPQLARSGETPTPRSRTGHANYWLPIHTMHQTPYTIVFPTTLVRHILQFPWHTARTGGQSGSVTDPEPQGQYVGELGFRRRLPATTCYL